MLYACVIVMSETWSVSPALWLFCALVFVIAGVVKEEVDPGLPMLAMALLALRLVSASAAALLILPSLVSKVRVSVDHSAVGSAA
ncbi:hypothetical protein [Ottowia sp.]|uniref:hypothetical protein n=1 Tax=Ottowia sp. TaxID=1898956 RepID=UPI002D1FADB3|nr:hypothetical protein [Ottowia sp.]